MTVGSDTIGAAGAARVSVLIVNWNTAELLDKAIASVFAHPCPFQIEVLVVDNGSIDGSVDMLRRNWPQVRLFALSYNTGFGPANNLAAQEASGDAILLLNSDAECRPRTIEILLAELDADPSLACVGPRHLNSDGSLQRSTNALPTLWNDTIELTGLTAFGLFRRLLRKRFPWWDDHEERIETGWVNGACMMIRRRAFEGVGGFDPDFMLYGEEVELCIRLKNDGWKVVFTPATDALHYEGRSLDHDPGLRLQLMFASHVRIYRKHAPAVKRLAFQALVSCVAAGRLLSALKRADAALVSTWATIMLHRPCDLGRLQSPPQHVKSEQLPHIEA